MTAYRLHFEPANLDTIRRVRAGEGDLVAFTSCFGQMLDPKNHRALHGIEAGPLFDMAPYPMNAIRFLFGAEPVEVISAAAVRHPEAGLGDPGRYHRRDSENARQSPRSIYCELLHPPDRQPSNRRDKRFDPDESGFRFWP